MQDPARLIEKMSAEFSDRDTGRFTLWKLPERPRALRIRDWL
jgi:hypothetical protein